MKPSVVDVMKGVVLLSELIPFFPSSEAAQRVIAIEVRNFVGSDEHLQWFIQAAVRQFPKFEGVPALRALYASRYTPDDNILPTLNVASPEQLEADFHRREMQENEQRMERYKQEALAAGEPLKAFPLPDVKRLN